MECGDCQACCVLLEIKETGSDFNKSCKHQCEKGCSIHGKHPEECKLFDCAWKQMEYAGIAMRPDICGVLFEKATDNVMYGITNTSLTDFVVGQFNYFNGEGISVVLIDHRDKSKTIFLARGHTREFVKREINDSTKLHRRSY